MRPFARLAEELESRPDDADRVDALARHLRAAGRGAGALAGGWLVVGVTPAGRPPRLSLAALTEAARVLAAQGGTASWLFDAGLAAAAEPAEAIALLLPWPVDGEPVTLPAWLAAWRTAAARPPEQRAAAVAAAIATLDDAVARRWAVRAACGLARPLATPWQWQRAWALAFDLDPRDTAWHWERDRARLPAAASLPGLEAAPPLPHPFEPLQHAAVDEHAAWLAHWHGRRAFVEPRWRGVRVQVVRRGAEVAVWQRAGPLLNAVLPATLLALEAWPDDVVLEAVLVAWQAGRAVPLEDARGRKRAVDSPTLHLVLVDWHRWPGESRAEVDAAHRHARLHARWPAPELVPAPARLPEVFTVPRLELPADLPEPGLLARLAAAWHAAGFGGLVLRHRHDGTARTLRPAPRRLRVVLQYVPGEALAAAEEAAAALALLPCGFAVWSRAPRSPEEQHAAMQAAQSGEFLPPPDDGDVALRLLPVARVPLDLPDDDLRRLHAWLRAHAGPRFGGVHAVAPAQVFELAFDGTRASRRHLSGVVLEGARVLAWVADAPPGAADTIATLASPG